MDALPIAVGALIALALLFDFSNGFHDAANAVATVVATRAMPPRWAVLFAAAFNFLAYFVVGTAVANTISKVVKSDYAGVTVVMAALVAAITWNYVTWWIGMPSSSSHALVGGLVGAGLAAGWVGAIDWSAVEKTLIAVVASPLVAFTVAFVSLYLVKGLQRLTGWHDNAKPFKGLQLLSAAAVSFGHGANDAQKTMGVIAALLLGAGYTTIPAGSDAVPVPEWVALMAYSAIALGTMWGGWKIIETMGLRLTRLHANSGAAANAGASTAIFGATALGIPISTTHAAASSVVGAGVASGQGVRMKVLGEMLVAWVLTVPAAAVVAFFIEELTHLPQPAAGLSIGCALFVVGGFIVYAMTHTIGVHDIEAELPQEDELATPLPIRPRLVEQEDAA